MRAAPDPRILTRVVWGLTSRPPVPPAGFPPVSRLPAGFSPFARLPLVSLRPAFSGLSPSAVARFRFPFGVPPGSLPLSNLHDSVAAARFRRRWSRAARAKVTSPAATPRLDLAVIRPALQMGSGRAQWDAATESPVTSGRERRTPPRPNHPDRRECAPRPGRGPITMREQTHRVTWFPPCRFRALRDHFGGARGLRAEEPILSFLLSSPILGPLTYPAFYGIWQTLEITRATGHVRVDLMLHRCHAAGGLLSSDLPEGHPVCRRRYPLRVRTTEKIISRQRGSRGAGLAVPESGPGRRGPCRIRCRCPRRGCRPG